MGGIICGVFMSRLLKLNFPIVISWSIFNNTIDLCLGRPRKTRERKEWQTVKNFAKEAIVELCIQMLAVALFLWCNLSSMYIVSPYKAGHSQTNYHFRKLKGYGTTPGIFWIQVSSTIHRSHDKLAAGILFFLDDQGEDQCIVENRPIDYLRKIQLETTRHKNTDNFAAETY